MLSKFEVLSKSFETKKKKKKTEITMNQNGHKYFHILAYSPSVEMYSKNN